MDFALYFLLGASFGIVVWPAFKLWRLKRQEILLLTKAWIRNMLGLGSEWATYQDWLNSNLYDTSPIAVEQGRLAWLDWMIAECKRNNW